MPALTAKFTTSEFYDTYLIDTQSPDAYLFDKGCLMSESLALDSSKLSCHDSPVDATLSFDSTLMASGVSFESQVYGGYKTNGTYYDVTQLMNSTTNVTANVTGQIAAIQNITQDHWLYNVTPFSGGLGFGPSSKFLSTSDDAIWFIDVGSVANQNFTGSYNETVFDPKVYLGPGNYSEILPASSEASITLTNVTDR